MAAERAGHNSGISGGISAEEINIYFTEIDEADNKLIELKAEHMAACKHPRARIRKIMKEARESGVNMPALRALVAEHRAMRKIDQRIDELEADERDEYEAMQQALGAFGDTELGQAALGKAKKPKGGSEKLDSLRT